MRSGLDDIVLLQGLSNIVTRNISFHKSSSVYRAKACHAIGLRACCRSVHFRCGHCSFSLRGTPWFKLKLNKSCGREPSGAFECSALGGVLSPQSIRIR